MIYFFFSLAPWRFIFLFIPDLCKDRTHRQRWIIIPRDVINTITARLAIHHALPRPSGLRLQRVRFKGRRAWRIRLLMISHRKETRPVTVITFTRSPRSNYSSGSLRIFCCHISISGLYLNDDNPRFTLIISFECVSIVTAHSKKNVSNGVYLIYGRSLRCQL